MNRLQKALLLIFPVYILMCIGAGLFQGSQELMVKLGLGYLGWMFSMPLIIAVYLEASLDVAGLSLVVSRLWRMIR